MNLQKTIKGESRISGRGMFGGKESKVVFRPAPVDSGVVFVRVDVPEAVRINAVASNLAERSRRTTIKKGRVSIETVEHCMAAISALSIDNLVIEVDGSELPAADCSCAEYFKILKRSGVVEQPEKRKEYTISEPISITSGDASIYALPYSDDGLNITYDLDYAGHTAIGRQIFSCRLTSENFEKNLAPARTFLLEAEAQQFQARGMGTHLSPRDILVLNSDGPIKNSFRFPNECVRHKIADLIGDLALIGRGLSGRIVAYKSGHSLNQRLATKLYEAAERQERMQKLGTDALLDIRQITKILPHRYPFLLVDKIVEIEGDTRIKGIKNVSFNEQFFQGHFPGTPIMPGVLIVEAMAQVSGLLFAQRLEHTGKLAVLLSMDDVKLRKPVVPGDQLILMAETVRLRKRTAQCRCKALVGDAIAAEAQIKFMLVDEEKV
ncbi:MAG: UDP-3-O-[3-hydroxymyristoyl] N-acetylglucosamine deacetylase [Phycisphaerae bacterium]|nr:UDP-3-O-[3-hydroxymyristoyl] N-acetylglucosamine deacetylase [Phycisphaerae bacterium]NIS50189.1 UDP-3-O-[3-hydroxymyristoyl] N-acetylglucosamine deacetylase [Phycisphaerae bacterium]NIU11440.1 UDP-3-O-[3-hydroxymyristoyl] N-acetylglucosamine deacetylase [Phycisphaerae bacterium]NIU56489.1 UDP-3-O-[3-hydroxymyristoyl] N-acetylglucosamine deacetylase [Phycisphaerae bacterium]NIV01835.1 UDP-3-O-[3-hydroxymyristoyl] N-acetylglucosamine deacetylase [Phycisphaerae bacterium]